MNFLCHVNCCNNQGVIPGVTYHKFPKIVAAIWFSVRNIPIRKVQNISEMIVCSDHFKREDYIDTKLKNGAIPSLYLKIPKDDATCSKSVLSSNKEDASCVALSAKANTNQINNPQLPAKPDETLKVSVLQKNNDPSVVEEFVDKNMEFADIITIADESEILTAIHSMHNYSISAQTCVNTKQQNKILPNAQVSNNLLNEKHPRTGKKAPCFKNKHKPRNKKESIRILGNRKIASHLKNNESYRVNEEELIENIILDHDYTIPDYLSLGEDVNNGAAYNIICSGNYVWKMKKKLGLYSRKTRSLRKRLDSLKSAVDVLKKSIL